MQLRAHLVLLKANRWVKTHRHHWVARFGSEAVSRLSSALAHVLDDPCFADGWYRLRAALPHYPLVLHRGGWPDGS